MSSATAPHSHSQAHSQEDDKIQYKLIFFTPLSHLPAIKSAIFTIGAGRYPGPGNYTEACFMTLGTAQFRPGANANPAIGTSGELEEVQEAKCEILCVGTGVVARAVGELKRTHPYETPAYEVYKMETF